MMNILFIIGKLQFKKISTVDQSQAFKSTLDLLSILNSHTWVLSFTVWMDSIYLTSLLLLIKICLWLQEIWTL